MDGIPVTPYVIHCVEGYFVLSGYLWFLSLQVSIPQNENPRQANYFSLKKQQKTDKLHASGVYFGPCVMTMLTYIIIGPPRIVDNRTLGNTFRSALVEKLCWWKWLCCPVVAHNKTRFDLLLFKHLHI